jgi:hypothetical protein
MPVQQSSQMKHKGEWILYNESYLSLCNRYQELGYSALGIATGYGLDVRGSIPGEVKISFSPLPPDRTWDPLTHL